jgi:hypothetical protein
MAGCKGKYSLAKKDKLSPHAAQPADGALRSWIFIAPVPEGNSITSICRDSTISKAIALSSSRSKTQLRGKLIQPLAGGGRKPFWGSGSGKFFWGFSPGGCQM